jgi:hypothetical protein
MRSIELRYGSISAGHADDECGAHGDGVLANVETAQTHPLTACPLQKDEGIDG